MSARIVWAIALGILLGVLMRSLFPLSWPFAALLILFALVACIYRLTDISKRNALLACAVACIAFAGGIVRMDTATLVGDPILSSRIDTKVRIEGVVAAEPDIREKNVRLHVQVSDLIYQVTTTTVSAKVLVLAPLHSEVAYGDKIRAEGVLQLPEKFDTSAGRVFDYPMFLAKDGILYQLSFAEIEVLGENRGNPIKKAVLSLKHLYLRGLQSVLPEPQAGLAGGITVGDKRAIGEELSETFQKVSLVHIVVLSGYNMTVVINGAAHVMRYISGTRSAQFVLSGIIVLVFIIMTGGAASATRAGAMALLATYARLTGRTFLALRILAVVAAAMVLWNPYMLLFDPGFQLSVLATLGLILFTPLISRQLAFITERYGLREIAASTLGTQIAVLPLLLYQNGLLSIVAIPANLLTLILVPLTMLLSFVAAIFGIFFGTYATLVGLPALLLLSYIIKVAEYLSAIPYASVSVPAFGAWTMLLMYAFLALLYIVVEKKSTPLG